MDIRKSHVDIGKVYFCTATINSWHKLLEEDAIHKGILWLVRHEPGGGS